MKRSPGVTIIGTLSMIGSILILLTAVLTAALSRRLPPNLEHANPLTNPSIRSFMMFVVLFTIAWAVWGIATSIGIFRLKNWARLSTLVFSVLLVSGGIFGAVIVAVMPIPVAPNQAAAPDFMIYMRFGMAAYYLLLAAVGVWWLIFFSRKSVKQQFSGSPLNVETNSSSRPLSITIIACYCLVSAACMLFFVPLHFPAILFNAVLAETAALLLYITYAAINLYIGIGLLRLDPRARLVAIGFSLFTVSNALIFYLLPGYQSRMQRMLESWLPSAPQNLPLPASTAFLFWFGALFPLTLIGLALYFLITRKSAFDEHALLPT